MEDGAKYSWQEAADSGQQVELRGQISGIKLISDLRLLTSVINDYNYFSHAMRSALSAN